MLALPAAAAADVQPYQANDYRGFMDIIPPGQNGLANGPDTAAFLTGGARPAHNDDQRGPYTNLLYAAPGLAASDLGTYFHDESFGVKPDDVGRTYSPRADVTIVRDKSVGVPHIYGTTRPGAIFGEGYVAAEDRLFMMDVLRHYGASSLSSLAGGANAETDREQWASAPYTDADLQKQVDQLSTLYGDDGRQLQQDAQSYVDGINAYISDAKLDPTKMPAEYAAIGKPAGPDPWKVTDLIWEAALIGGQLGNGGGDELEQARLLEATQKKFGVKRGAALWRDLRSANDPEAPITAKNKAFPYDLEPRKRAKGSLALPDPGTLKDEGHLIASSGSGGASARSAPHVLSGLMHFPTSDSNALLVSAKHSASGRPLAVFGSQAAYFSPEIYMEQDVHGPGIDARGATFPGVSLYVLIGRGQDYAWSATSAGQDIIDVFAVDLCNPDGSAPTLQSNAYVFHGQCTPMESLEHTNSWLPNVADQTPAGSETLRTWRTKMGLVTARATIAGKPVAYTSLRSTYLHEIDSALAFQDWNNPDKIHNVQDFQRSAYKLGFTFNWLYVDDKDIGYINTGANPVRAPGVDGLLPVRAQPQFEWRGYNPDDRTETLQPFDQRPQVINQDTLVSWNNKQAVGCCGGDNYTPIYRSQILDHRINARIKTHKIQIQELVDAMADGATVDLRGERMLPWALRILGTPKDPRLADAVAKLKAWSSTGAHRIDRNRDGAYDDADAVRIMDAWDPLMQKAIFEPVFGADLYKTWADIVASGRDTPNTFGGQAHAHLGSSWEHGAFGYEQKDFRTILRHHVRGRYSMRFCGNGGIKRCRGILENSLSRALDVSDQQLYGNDPTISPADCGKMSLQPCYDAIRYRALGAITQPLEPWQNRPTQQQVVEVQGHRPR